MINLARLIHSEPLVNFLNKENSRHSFTTWEDTIKANLFSTFYLSSLVAETMVKKRIRGLIVNISSIAAQGILGQTAYAAGKAGCFRRFPKHWNWRKNGSVNFPPMTWEISTKKDRVIINSCSYP